MQETTAEVIPFAGEPPQAAARGSPAGKALYLDHFGLKCEPFGLAPDARFHFASRSHARAEKQLRHVLAHECALVAVAGEIGIGKTLQIKRLLAEMPETVVPIVLDNPSFGRDEILREIADGLGIALPSGVGKRDALAAIESVGRAHVRSGRLVQIVIDEAHLMPPESLEEIRLLTNMEDGGRPLFGILLVGQTELRDVLLARRDLRQVLDRIKYWIALDALDADEIEAYLDHRLRCAGWSGGRLFSRRQAHFIWRAAAGRPRRINLIADRALLAAYVSGRRAVTMGDVRQALGEVGKDAAARARPRALHWLALACLAGAAVLVAWLAWQARVTGEPRTDAAAAQRPGAVPAQTRYHEVLYLRPDVMLRGGATSVSAGNPPKSGHPPSPGATAPSATLPQ